MMQRFALVALAALALAACSEQRQTLGANSDHAPAYAGTGKAFSDPGWKAGDKQSWESHLRARGQYGQNDHNRMP
jgi:hypothetical protein